MIKSRIEAGKKGGDATKKKYGIEHFRAIGRKGGQKQEAELVYDFSNEDHLKGEPRIVCKLCEADPCTCDNSPR